MKTNTLGRTGLQVSELVFGGGFVGGILLHASDDVRREAIRRALDGGINWIDTAASYGNGQSEEVVGWLLSELPESRRPQVSTKVAVDSSGGSYLDQIRRSLTASLARLQMTRVPLLQLHNKLGDGQNRLPVDELIRPAGVLDAFDALKSDGVIDHAGFTALGDPAACLAVVETGRVDTAQVYYNAINPSAGIDVPAAWYSENYQGLLHCCQVRNVGVLGIRVYAAGILATGEQHGREIPVTSNADYDSERRRAEVVMSALADVSGSDSQKALRFVLDQPAVNAAVIGLAELSHLDEALAVPHMPGLGARSQQHLRELWASNFGQTA